MADVGYAAIWDYLTRKLSDEYRKLFLIIINKFWTMNYYCKKKGGTCVLQHRCPSAYINKRLSLWSLLLVCCHEVSCAQIENGCTLRTWSRSVIVAQE